MTAQSDSLRRTPRSPTEPLPDGVRKITHEFKTPLEGILEVIIAVMTADPASLRPESRQALISALREGTACLRTVQNLLDFLQLERNGSNLELHDVDFSELVNEAIVALGHSSNSSEVAIERHFDEPFPRIHTDLSKTSQILFGLLDNAVKFTQRGRIEIHAGVRDHRLRCEIRDTGIGICAADQRRVFDEFYQVEPENSPGLGLGLTLALHRVESLEGTIELESKPGHGTAVSFEIPARPTGPSTGESGPRRRLPRRGNRA
ncbi:HAMP domain-containing histidine kinase [Myxococcota bacterium]|nr:HAMP domain-containing histidine kinase [Myxococcota bacterium]